MASSAGYSDIDPRRMSARKDYYERTRPSSPYAHKRSNSVELILMGGQFLLFSKHTTCESAKELDIPEEDTSCCYDESGEPKRARARGTLSQSSFVGSSRAGPRLPPTPAPVRGVLPMSQEELRFRQRAELELEITLGTSYLLLRHLGCAKAATSSALCQEAQIARNPGFMFCPSILINVPSHLLDLPSVYVSSRRIWADFE